MKKIIVLIAISAFFSACKKDYTCECTTTVGSFSSTDKYVIKGVTKDRAKVNCVSTTYESSGVTVTKTCSLK